MNILGELTPFSYMQDLIDDFSLDEISKVSVQHTECICLQYSTKRYASSPCLNPILINPILF